MWPFKKRPPKCQHNWWTVTCLTGTRIGHPVSIVSQVCALCNSSRSVEIGGYWTLDILNRDWVANPPKP